MSHRLYPQTTNSSVSLYLQTARHFPPNLLPTTRIALALSLMRVMPYLICQSLETWSTLPGMLHPTNLQQRVLHRIEYAFIPIPKLRECMIDHSTPTTTDWIAHLAAHSCHVAYPNHNNADVNDAIDGHVGAHNDIKIKPSSTTNTTPLTPDNMKETLILQNDSRYTDMVTRDLKTGQLYISPGFERACWTFENWSVSRGILGVWPDLNGHIKVD